MRELFQKEFKEFTVPAIFTEQARSEMRDNMLDIGFKIISERGISSIKINEISQKAGVAKGTFYNFFPSKEEFIYQVIVSKRILIANILEETAQQNGGKINRANFKKWLELMWKNDNNLYRSISYEDYDYLRSKWPEEHTFNPEIDQETSKWVLSLLENPREDAQWQVFANIQKVLALMNLNHEILHQDALDDTTDMFLEDICEAIFG